jgi:DNA-binding MarR family transcriptional regulator
MTAAGLASCHALGMHRATSAGHDRRSVAVLLTEQGTAAAANVLDSRRSVLQDAVTGLSPSERAALTATLQQALAALDFEPSS